MPRALPFALLVLVGLGSLAFDLTLSSRLPSDADWAEVAGALRARTRPGDAVQLWPPWAERARLFVDAAPVLADDASEKFLGDSRYSASSDGASCECAITVLDEWHNKGLGSVLMKHLIEVARARGILHMYTIDSVENLDMDDLAEELGFTRRIDPDDGTQAIHSLWL